MSTKAWPGQFYVWVEDSKATLSSCQSLEKSTAEVIQEVYHIKEEGAADAILLQDPAGQNSFVVNQAPLGGMATTMRSDNFFGVGRSMLTLGQFVTLDGLTEVIYPLMVQKHWLVAYFFAVLLVISIGLLNLVTAALVENAMENAAATAEEEREKLKKKSMEKRGRGDVLFRNLNRDDGLWQTAQLKTKSNTSQPKAVKGEEKPRSKQRSAEEILAGFRSGWTEKLQEEPVTSDAQADLGERTERKWRKAVDDLLLQVDAALKDLKEHPKTVPASSPSEFEKLNEEESFEDALKDVRSATNAAPKDANLSVPSQSIVLTQSMMSSASMREGGEAREAREGPLRKSMSSNSLLRSRTTVANDFPPGPLRKVVVEVLADDTEDLPAANTWWQWLQQKCIQIVRSRWFEFLAGFVILLNLITIGIEAHVSAGGQPSKIGGS
eukprot:g3422.t1